MYVKHQKFSNMNKSIFFQGIKLGANFCIFKLRNKLYAGTLHGCDGKKFKVGCGMLHKIMFFEKAVSEKEFNSCCFSLEQLKENDLLILRLQGSRWENDLKNIQTKTIDSNAWKNKK